MKIKQILTPAALLLAGLAAANAATIPVTNADINGSVNWTKNNEYILSGFVFVENGETLNIEAGTVIKALPGSGNNVSALVVSRGGKIFANGTAAEPIIFTAENDDVTDSEDLGIFDRGLWGGVVILGKAPINTAVNAGGNAASPKFEVYEGLPDIENFRYGGNEPADNSGVFRYVSIRHGGKLLESNKEINGLSMGGVGNGTTIEYVETYAIADDGYEFFGGTVNTKYLISAFNDDDSFDADQGHRGKHQFWLGIQEPLKRDKGAEWNGEPSDIAVGAQPTGAWEVYNWTSIGAGAGSGGSGNNALTVRVYNSAKVYNSIFTDFAQQGITIDSTSANFLASGGLDFRDNIWWGFGGGNNLAGVAGNAAAQVLFNETSRNNAIVDPMLQSISRFTNGLLKPFPALGSPARSSARTAPNDGFYTTTANFKGAFKTENWAKWSYLAKLGILTMDNGPQDSVTPALRPQLTLARTAGGMDVSFPTETGRVYQLQTTSDFSSWGNVRGGLLTGNGSEQMFNIMLNAPFSFYRVTVE